MPRGRKTSRSGIVTRSGTTNDDVRVTRNSPRKDNSLLRTPPPLGRRVHPSHHSPSPTTPPKLKKTPQKRSPQRLSPASPNKITNYFSPTANGHVELDPVVYADEIGDDVVEEEEEIVYATAEELEEDGCSVCEDSGSGKENEDWRALSPRLEQPAVVVVPDGPEVVKVKDVAQAAANSSSGSPLQPRRVVTRSHTAKNVPKNEDISKISAKTQPVSPLYTLTNGAPSPTRKSMKTPPQSPPTPHKIKLLEERTRIAEVAAGASSPSAAKKLISFSPKKEEIKPLPTEVKVEEQQAEQLQTRCRRNLTRLLDPSDNKTSLDNEPRGPKTIENFKDGNEVKQEKTASKKVNGVIRAGLQTKSSKVTDFFPIRRSERKPKTALAAKQQSEIESWLEKTGYVNDGNLGIAIQWYENKGRGIEAKKHFNKGDFVVEYAGDLMEGTAAAKLREEKYASDAATGCYMYYFKHGDKHYCIDATAESGRLGRLVNHSRLNPNCQTKVVLVKDIPRLILVAKTDIEPGTELLYDYGDRSKESLKAHPWLAL